MADRWARWVPRLTGIGVGFTYGSSMILLLERGHWLAALLSTVVVLLAVTGWSLWYCSAGHDFAVARRRHERELRAAGRG